MRSELNSEQRRVGLRPPAALRLEENSDPSAGHAPATMAAFHGSQASAAPHATRQGRPVPSTPPPRRPVPEKLPPSRPDDVDAAAPAQSTYAPRSPPPFCRNLAAPMEARALQPPPRRASGAPRVRPESVSRRITTTPSVRPSARAVIDRGATERMRNTWTRRQAVGGAYMSSVARAGATCEHRAGGPARGAPV
ncbi:hypothetical protein GQ55_1G320300 [Panicum hallii var. hallii]|jgi:hypothetical protein|uniref:Uncharacterized protein n=2 Tax=Panicum hallii TaxID=206008 RepID=A0A2T7F9Q9_9POAL|nr:hypothetical protein GQ55_1G320300 [Panicum hallii var. hallii]PVH66723.1 hypothetical protein PAHAL_1G328600 [Panicum hallii]